MRFRFFFLTTSFLFVYSLLIFNIYNLQIEKGGYYAAQAASQNRLAGLLEPRRGNFYFTDRENNKIPAAINRKYPVIFAVPKEIKELAMLSAALSPILNIPKDKLIALFNKPNDLYEALKRKASLDQVEKIRNLNAEGIYIDEEDLRFYPFQGLASQLLGFVAPSFEDNVPAGRYGLEFFYNTELSGSAGRIENGEIIHPNHGKDIYLTIDSNIQTRGEEILQNLIQKYNAESGLFIVQDPNSGKILAMGSYPNFDPNNYSAYRLDFFLNPNTQAIYEPGSVMKVITMSAGIDSKKLTPETTFYDSGSLALNGRIIKNWDKKAHGKVTMTEVVEQSINTGAAHAQKLIGNDLFYNYLLKFGFGEKTGIGLPGEVNGSLANLKSSFREINFATAAFGQGISVTPIQLISAISAIANGGVLMKPFLLKDEKPIVVRRVISEETAKEVTKMMISAVRKAMIAQIPKFDIAGKTGTAQIPDFKKGGYLEEFIHTYVGFAPAFHPRFTILIRIDKPEASLAGLTVVPAFKEFSEFILNYYNVAPDYLE